MLSPMSLPSESLSLGMVLATPDTLTLEVYGGTSLVVQWLRLSIPNAEGLGSIPGQGTRSCMPRREIPQQRSCVPQLRPGTAK